MTKKVDLKLILAVVAAGLLSFCGIIVETAMNVTFPILMKQFDINTATVQWMTTAYLLVVAIMVPISAFLKRRFRTKALFVTANLLFITGLVIDAFTTKFGVLVLGRVVQGLGTGIALPLMFNIILDWGPEEQLGTLMGIGTLITAIGPALGPTFGGLVVSSLGIRWIFILLLPLLVISLLLGLYAIRQTAAPQRVSFDVVAWVMIMLIFVGFTLTFSNLQNVGQHPGLVLGYLVVGVAGLIGFTLRTSRSKNPLINLELFRIRSFDWHLGGFFLVQMTALGMAFVLPNYMQLVNGQTALVAGMVLLPGAAIGAICAPLGGRILDRFGAAKPILTGAVVLAVAVIGLAGLGMRLTPAVILGIYIVAMLGIGLTMGNTMTSGLNQVQGGAHADGNAVFNTLQQFAGAIGTSIVSTIITLIQNQSTGTMAHRIARGSRVALGFLVILVALNVVALTMAMRTRKRD